MTYRYIPDLSTRGELADGAAAFQELTAHCHAQAVDFLERGYNDYAIAWQKAHAIHHRASAEFLRLLLVREETSK